MSARARDRLLDEALDVVSRLFGDKSVSRARTRERLEEVQAQIESSLEALDADDD